jgi:hypothetical protein
VKLAAYLIYKINMIRNDKYYVGLRTGATIISAAAVTQFTFEEGDLKNGVFTYSILELMKQNGLGGT